MSKRQRKINESFLDSYIGMDKICCHKFGVSSGGVTAYINRLISTRLAPGRDEALQRLVKYRSIRNKFAHESGALENMTEIAKADLKWLERFKKELNKSRDPYFAYLKKAHRVARRKRAKKVFLVILILLLIAAAAVAYFMFF